MDIINLPANLFQRINVKCPPVPVKKVSLGQEHKKLTPPFSFPQGGGGLQIKIPYFYVKSGAYHTVNILHI